MTTPMWNWKVSAKGAAFISKPGAAPQDARDIQKSALKARVTSGKLDELNRAFSASSRFDRIPGPLAQANSDIAPLALNTAAPGIEQH